MEDMLGQEILQNSVLHYNNRLFVVKRRHFWHCYALEIRVLWGRKVGDGRDHIVSVRVLDKPSKLTRLSRSLVIPREQLPREVIGKLQELEL